jgi:hypothetical protein
MSINTVELDIEQVTKLVQSNLIDDYYGMIENIKILEPLLDNRDFGLYKNEDLADAIKFSSALKIILEYYMIPSEYKEMFPE